MIGISDIRKRIKNLNRRRSEAGVEQDNRRKAKTIYKPPLSEEQWERYKKNPNRIDILGIDTPEGTTVKTVKKPTVKKRIRKKSEASYEEYLRASENYAADKMTYHEDMRAKLYDDDYGEVAKNSRWKWNERDTKKATIERECANMMMVYNKKPKTKKTAKKTKRRR